jgi:hypothetical protein
MLAQRGSRSRALLILYLDARPRCLIKATSGRFTPLEKAGWAPGPDWRCVETITCLYVCRYKLLCREHSKYHIYKNSRLSHALYIRCYSPTLQSPVMRGQRRDRRFIYAQKALYPSYAATQITRSHCHISNFPSQYLFPTVRTNSPKRSQ